MAEEIATASEIEDFLRSALLSWVESCMSDRTSIISYQSLLDGHILHSIWLQIDPEPHFNPTSLDGFDGVNLSIARAKNFDMITRNIKLLYEEELGQTILTLPDCCILGFFPDSKTGLKQMKTLITLLLGAAVQCPNKEIIIGRIKELDIDTQHKLVEIIKQVTDYHSLVLTQESLEALSASALNERLLTLTKERDSYYSKWTSLITNETEKEPNLKSFYSNGNLSCGGTHLFMSKENNHIAVELADFKSKIRKMRQEIEEKSELLIEVKEELDYRGNQYEKLRAQSQEWHREAKKAATYRDEIDILRERAERADRLEIDVQRIREKLADAEFYKIRTEELREDNRMLLETKDMLEEQLQRSRKRSEQVMGLESEIIRFKQTLNEMALERDADKNKLQELLEENNQLKQLTSFQKVKLSYDNEDCIAGDNSLSEQLTNEAQTRALKMELENHRLAASLEQYKASSYHDCSNKLLDLEKDKKKLSLLVDQFQENYNRVIKQNKELEEVFLNAREENKKLQDAIVVCQKVIERQSQEKEIERFRILSMEGRIDTLSKEKQRKQSLLESIQRKITDMERIIEVKTNEIELIEQKAADLEKTKNELYALKKKLENNEKEIYMFNKEINKLKEYSESKSAKLDDFVIQCKALNIENRNLREKLHSSLLLANKIQELETVNKDFLLQQKIHQDTICKLREELFNETLIASKLKHYLHKLGLVDIEVEKKDLKVESVIENLISNPNTFKTVCEVLIKCAKADSNLNVCVLCHRKKLFVVEKNIEVSVDNLEHSKQFGQADSIECKEPNNELEKFRAKKMCFLNEIDDLRSENARLNVDVSTLHSQIKSLSTQHLGLQLANSQLAADKDALLKQSDALNQMRKTHDQDIKTLQNLHDQLSAEYEALNKEKETLKTINRDLRSENRVLKDNIDSLEKTISNQKEETTMMKSSIENLAILRIEHNKLTQDFKNLFLTNDRFKNEYKNIQDQYKILRGEYGCLKLQNTELTGKLNMKIDQLNILEVEYVKVSQRSDILLQMNSNLDSDRKTLMDNISQLLTQYHELLTYSLEDKQHYHMEEKNYTERVNSLNRQKEKLEEKIMEHYKKSNNCTTKKKAFGSSFVKRVKKASTDLMNKVPSRNRRSWIDEARHSQFNLGSESGGNESDNSVEEPISILTDSQFTNEYNLKGILPSMDKSLAHDSTCAHLQTISQEATSISQERELGLSQSDMPGSSLKLGVPGCRRTVYLIDENQKLSEKRPNTVDIPRHSDLNENTNYFIYNRINTNIEDLGASNASMLPQNERIERTSIREIKSSTAKANEDNKNDSIWYEYGCV